MTTPATGAVFVVTYEHPDEEGWRAHVMPHVAWLRDRVADGSLLASGPLEDTDVKSAVLIMRAADEAALAQVIASDPFAEHGLIENLEVRRWNPLFGAFSDLASKPAGLD